MNRLTWFAGVAALAGVASVRASDPPAGAIDTITDKDIAAHIRVLASDEFEGGDIALDPVAIGSQGRGPHQLDGPVLAHQPTTGEGGSSP